MGRYYKTDSEQRGYDDRKEQGRYSEYPYSGDIEYRAGWEDRERDERLERERRDEERQIAQMEEERQQEKIKESEEGI